MRTEIQAKMNHLAFVADELVKELRLDPEPDAQYCSRSLTQAIGFLNMSLNNQFGKKLSPVELKPAAEISPAEAVNFFGMDEAGKPVLGVIEKPKPAKKPKA